MKCRLYIVVLLYYILSSKSLDIFIRLLDNPHHVFQVYPFPFRRTPFLKSTRLCSVPVVRSQNISVPFPYPHRVQPSRTRSVSFPSFGGGIGTGTDIVPRTSSYGIGLLGRAPRQAPMFLIKKHWPFFRGPFCLTLFSAFF